LPSAFALGFSHRHSTETRQKEKPLKVHPVDSTDSGKRRLGRQAIVRTGAQWQVLAEFQPVGISNSDSGCIE
jgi:hypothetical protein